LLMGLAVVYIGYVKDRHDYESRKRSPAHWGVGILVVYALTFQPLGFMISSFLFIAAWLGVLARLSAWRSLLIAVVSALVLVFVVAGLMGVGLPPGMFSLASLMWS